MVAPDPSVSAYRFGVFHVDLHTGELHKKGVRIRLQPKPFQALALLLARNGDLVTRQELFRELWPAGTFVEFEDGLNAVMKRLRVALGDSAENPRFVETIPRRGYRFIAPVVPAAAGEAVPAPPVSSAETARESAAEATPRSLAVLPLEDLSRDPAQEYFAEGLTDELNTCLARIPELRVISRTSAMQYRSPRKSLPEIGRELGVDVVLEGTVQRSGTRVRLRVQLVQTATDRHLWVESYDRELTEILALESELAHDVARQVRLLMTSHQALAPARRAVNPAAFEDYLRGRYFWNRRDAEALTRAVDSFRRAIEVDPSYSPAYAGLASCYLLLGGLEGRPDVYAEQARSTAEQASRLDPTLSEAHTVLALLNEQAFDFAEAEREYKLAIALGPNDATAHHWYASGYLAEVGRFEEAERMMKRALALDPVSRIIATDWGAILYFERRYDEAAQVLSKVIDLAPEFSEARMWRAMVLAEKRKYGQAIADLEVARQHDDTPRRLAMLGWGCGVAGKRERAKSVLARLKVLSKQTYVSSWSFAVVHLGLGEIGQAVSWMEKAYAERSLEMIALRVAPLYDLLRRDPRFTRLIARVGLPAGPLPKP